MHEWTYTTDVAGVIAWVFAAVMLCWGAYQKGCRDGVEEAPRTIKQATGED